MHWYYGINGNLRSRELFITRHRKNTGCSSVWWPPWWWLQYFSFSSSVNWEWLPAMIVWTSYSIQVRTSLSDLHSCQRLIFSEQALVSVGVSLGHCSPNTHKWLSPVCLCSLKHRDMVSAVPPLADTCCMNMFPYLFIYFIEKFSGWTLRPQDIIAVHHTITKYIRWSGKCKCRRRWGQ
jgi:hypothetical protein